MFIHNASLVPALPSRAILIRTCAMADDQVNVRLMNLVEVSNYLLPLLTQLLIMYFTLPVPS
jgi:hypothetical protein